MRWASTSLAATTGAPVRTLSFHEAIIKIAVLGVNQECVKRSERHWVEQCAAPKAFDDSTEPTRSKSSVVVDAFIANFFRASLLDLNCAKIPSGSSIRYPTGTTGGVTETTTSVDPAKRERQTGHEWVSSFASQRTMHLT